MHNCIIQHGWNRLIWMQHIMQKPQNFMQNNEQQKSKSRFSPVSKEFVFCSSTEKTNGITAHTRNLVCQIVDKKLSHNADSRNRFLTNRKSFLMAAQEVLEGEVNKAKISKNQLHKIQSTLRKQTIFPNDCQTTWHNNTLNSCETTEINLITMMGV